jgi:hypothetical protein
MSFGSTMFVISLAATLVFLWRHVRLSFGLSSTLLGLVVLLHGPAYWYYTRQWSLGEGALFRFYNSAWPQIGTAAQETTGGRFASNMRAAVAGGSAIERMDLALALSLLALCAGIWLADRVFRQTPQSHGLALSRWSSASRTVDGHTRSTLMPWLAIAGALLMMLFVYRDAQLAKVYTYFFTHAGEFEKIAMRRQMGGSNSYFFNLMLSTVLPFIAFYLWSWWRDGGRYGVLALTGTFLLLLITAKLATLSKAPGAIFVLQLLVLEFARRSLRVNVRQGLMLMGFSLVLFSAMTFAANSDLGGIQQSLVFLFYRVFMIPNESLLEYFSAFPQYLAHTHGHDIRPLAKLMGIEPLQANYWRVAELHRGVPGSATTAMFVADAWAAWAWQGVAAVSLALGFLVRWIDIELIVKRGRSCASIAGIGLGHHGLFIAMSTSFQTALLTGGLALVLPLVAIAQWRLRRHPQVHIAAE